LWRFNLWIWGLKNRVAIVTGSSQGIGKAFAYGLAKEGANVTICARTVDTLKTTAKEIESMFGTEVLAFSANRKVKENIQAMVKATANNFGRIDVLVNNTGGPPSALFHETTDKDWQETFNSLLMSIVNCCHEVMPYMRAKKWGRIINMISFAAKQPAERLFSSNAIRAGVLGLTKTLSNELAEYGILVNAVCPSWTPTDRVKRLAQSIVDKTGKDYDAIISEWARSTALNRLAQLKKLRVLWCFWLLKKPATLLAQWCKWTAAS
jgi:3-oxoacyl-[acyl-carrier protein] reductase